MKITLLDKRLAFDMIFQHIHKCTHHARGTVKNTIPALILVSRIEHALAPAVEYTQTKMVRATHITQNTEHIVLTIAVRRKHIRHPDIAEDLADLYRITI